MELFEARTRVIDAVLEWQPDVVDVVLQREFADEKLQKAMMLIGLAKNLDMWEEAEALYEDPVITDSVFSEFQQNKLAYLGISAANMGKIERARSFFGRIEYKSYDPEVHIVDGLLKNGRIDEAEAIIRKIDFSTIDHGGMQRRLGSVVSELCRLEGGPRKALSLVTELVPSSENSAIEDKQMERSRMDYYVEAIAPAAIMQDDFDCAEDAVALLHNWFGLPAAMGGGGLIDEAYVYSDESVMQAIRALIYRKWGVGDSEKIIQASKTLRPAVAAKIHEWLGMQNKQHN